MKTSRLLPRKSEKIDVMHYLNCISLKAKGTCKRRLLLIIHMDCNLVVARVSIQEAEVTLSYQTVQDLVDER